MFIAGASNTGHGAARMEVVTASSPMPARMRAMRFAVAGATMKRSAERPSSRCPKMASPLLLNRSLITGWPVSAWKVTGVTNSVALRVMTTRTQAPRFISSRASSQTR